MPNPTITVSFSNPDPSTQITDFPDLVDNLNALLSATLQGTFVPYVLSDSVPAVNDQDKAWLQKDAGGRPISVKLFYGGEWRRFYTGRPNEISMFTGNPATYFDGTGLGLTTGEWDGWALCNGNNSTPNLSNQFVIGGQMDNEDITGYSSGWQTNITGAALKTGGNATYTLINNNLPSMKVQLSGSGNFDANQSPHSTKAAIVTGKYTGSEVANTVDVQSFGADPTGNPAVPQVAIPTVPNFYTLAFCMWVGYG